MAEASTVKEWRALSLRYVGDSDALETVAQAHGALYLYGYAAETAAKAAALQINRPVVRIHNLVALVHRAKVSGLGPEEQAYAEWRDVEFRYEVDLPTDWTDRLAAAKRLVMRLNLALDRDARRRRR